ncbi:MAG: GSU2403 family nucleotidyltransferase fold protein [Planctomycetota bacterium]
MIDRHGEDTQTLHAELTTLLLALEADRSWSHLAGAFATKTIAGGDYVYFQYSDPGGRKRQFSIGRSSPALQAIVDAYREGVASYAADLERIDRLARLLATAGLATLSHPVARVVRALADAGVFRLGGVLVGTYAFLVLGNTLGVRWPAGTWHTEDVDVAGHLEVATPALEADVPGALDSLKMGFVPVPPFDPRHASTSFKVRGKQLRLDLLTPGSERSGESCYIPRFRAAAAPIKWLSLVMADAQPAAAVHGGATLVVVPGPARFALHKLLVSQTRSVVQQTKSAKDLHQAALLLEVLAEDRPDDLEQAVHEFNTSGPAVTKKVARGLRAVEKRWPDASSGVSVVRRLLEM